jgi:hypothetical protein
MDNMGFAPRLAATIDTIPPPERRIVELIRKLDSLGVHNKELRAEDRRRVFPLAG